MRRLFFVNIHLGGFIMKNACAMIAASLVLASGSAWAAPDISGIAIGEDYATAKAAIAKMNPSYKFTTEVTSGNDADRKVVGVIAEAKGNAGGLDQFVIMKNDAGVVWFVAKYQVFEKGDRPRYKGIGDALIKKYGKETKFDNSVYKNYYWMYDREGKLSRIASDKGPCGDGLGYGAQSFIDAPQSFSSKCGMFMKAFVSVTQDGMVDRLGIKIADIKIMYDELHMKSSQATQEQERQLNAEKAENVRPLF
jgi:hypothetical protein